MVVGIIWTFTSQYLDAYISFEQKLDLDQLRGF
jgi:hypothetical protein